MPLDATAAPSPWPKLIFDHPLRVAVEQRPGYIGLVERRGKEIVSEIALTIEDARWLAAELLRHADAR